MSIRNISSEDVHRITSGQVIVDLSTAVKELVENAIDAGATSVEVSLKNYGFEGIEVVDNGGGIKEEDFESIALKHHTSKIDGFEDLERVRTLGFRGEALSSLCGISSLKLITTTTGPKATSLTFDTAGKVREKSVCTRAKGTTVIVADLFKNLPVRRKDFTKNHKREFNKCISLLQQYTLINTSVRFTIFNTTPKGKKTIVLSSQGKSLKNNIISVYGSNGMYGLIPVDLKLDLNQYKSRLKMLDTQADYTITISGYISKTSFGYGRSATDRQVFFINNRPVELKPFTKLINEIYKQYNHVQYPVIILNLDINTQFLDVNVTPDKRTILIHNEVYVIEEFRAALTQFFDGQDLSIPRNMEGQRSLESLRGAKEEVIEEEEPKVKLSLKGRSFAYGLSEEAEEDEEPEVEPLVREKVNEKPTQTLEVVEEEEEEVLEVRKRPSDTQLVESAQKRVQEFLSEKELRELEELGVDTTEVQVELEREVGDLEDVEMEEDEEVLYEQPQAAQELEEESEEDELEPVERPKSRLINLGDLHAFKNGSNVQARSFQKTPKKTQPLVESFIKKNSHEHCHHDHDEDSEEESEQEDEPMTTLNPLRSTPQTDVESQATKYILEEHDDEIQVTQVKIRANGPLLFETEASLPQEFAQLLDKSVFTEKKKVEIDDIDNTEESENYLTLTVAKSDFESMKIIGQFNLGFILVIREKDGKQDLFIIDQHASDEKYNFEDLQKNTVFDSQRLVVPQTMELNVLDELVVMDHLEVFEKNGFQLKIDEEGIPGERVKLISLPISKRKAFDTTDFYELVHLVKESPGNTSSLRCSKIRSMFAMRACRKSIMIGRHLSFKTMDRVVKHLGTLDKPWNCPHGRPTMRHLMELQQWEPFNEDYTA